MIAGDYTRTVGADATPRNCSVARALDLVGDRWTILLLYEAFSGVHRFDEMQRNLGIARNILAARLQTLTTAGVLTRRPYQDRPPRHEYHLTRKGYELFPALAALMEWGDRWCSDAPPVTLVHRDCGEPIAPSFRCAHCEVALEAGSVEAVRAGVPVPVPATA